MNAGDLVPKNRTFDSVGKPLGNSRGGELCANGWNEIRMARADPDVGVGALVPATRMRDGNERELDPVLTLDGLRWFVSIDQLDCPIAEVAIGRKVLGWFMCHPFEVEIPKPAASSGKTLRITLYGTLRNLLGPHHSPDGELAACGPGNYSAHPEIDAAPHTITQLQRVKSSVLGVVLNNVDLAKHRYGYSDGYYYYYQRDQKRTGIFNRQK